MPDTLHWKIISYGLRLDVWLLWEYQNKTDLKFSILKPWHCRNV